MAIKSHEIEELMTTLRSALFYAKEASQVAKKVYGDDKEVAWYLRTSREEVLSALRLFDIHGVKENTKK